MKILLLNPPFKTELGRFSRSSRSPAIAKSGTLYYPIWLAYATGVLEKAGHEVKLIDACAYKYDRPKTIELALKFQPRLIVIDTSTPSIYNDIEIGALLKDALPKSVIVLVGTHPSALAVETLQLNKKIDAIAHGEYDYTLRDLASALSHEVGMEGIAGIIYRQGEAIIKNQNRPFIENLDDLPFVSAVYKKHLDVRKYFFSAGLYPMVMTMAGRGCPHRCFFCVYPQTFHGRCYRLRSADNVTAEFEYIIKDMPEIKAIGIEDDTFTSDIGRARRICELLIKKGTAQRISWWANVRVDLDFETMKLLKAAGCRIVIPGFESGSQEILDNMKKGIKLEQSLAFARNAKKAGLLVHGCFMVGNPGETRRTMLETLKFAIKLRLDTAQFFPLIPYPGTEAYAWSKAGGFLKETGYDKWLTTEGYHKALVGSANLTAAEITAFCDYARRKYYLRPGYIWYKLKQCLFSGAEARRTFRSLKTFAKYLLKQELKQKPL